MAALMPSASDRAHELLRQMLGPQASFRDRQLEGILTSFEDRARTPSSSTPAGWTFCSASPEILLNQPRVETPVRLLVRPAFEHVAHAPDRAGVRHELQNLPPLHHSHDDGIVVVRRTA
jgi:hypothetical protein